MENDDIIALNALLGLTGQVLNHRTQMKSIKTDADLRRDELQFKIKKQQDSNELELQRFSLQLSLKKINEYDSNIATAEDELHKKTGKRSQLSEQDITKGGAKLNEDHKNNMVSRWRQEAEKYQIEADRKFSYLKNVEDKNDEMDELMSAIDRNYSTSSGPGDGATYSVEDWDGAMEMALDQLGIDETNEFMDGLVEMNSPNSRELLKLNSALATLEHKETTWDYQKGSVMASQQVKAQQYITDMASFLHPSDDGNLSPVMQMFTDKLDAAMKDGTSLYGLPIDEGYKESMRIDLVRAVNTGHMSVLQGMIRESPWLEEALIDLMPEQWAAYHAEKLKYNRIASGAPSKLSTVPKNDDLPPPDIDTETTTGLMLEFFKDD